MLDTLAEIIVKLDGVKYATRNGEEVDAIVIGHVDYERIAELAGDVEVRVAPFKVFPVENLSRFKADEDVVEWFNQLGRPMHEGVAKMIAARAGLKHPPILNAIVGDKYGILFHDAEDRSKYEEYALRPRLWCR